MAKVSSFICSIFSLCKAIANSSTCQFSEGKGYFQRMKIDFPLDLCIIKEHNNETRFCLRLPPAAFWHLAELSFDLMTCEWRERQGSVVWLLLHSFNSYSYLSFCSWFLCLQQPVEPIKTVCPKTRREFEKREKSTSEVYVNLNTFFQIGSSFWNID